MSQHVAHRHSDEIHELRAEIERLRADNKQMRAALQKIRDTAITIPNGDAWSAGMAMLCLSTLKLRVL